MDVMSQVKGTSPLEGKSACLMEGDHRVMQALGKKKMPCQTR